MIQCEVPFQTVDAKLAAIIEPEAWTEEEARTVLPRPTKVVEFLRMKNVPSGTRLNITLNYVFLLPKTMRQLACNCAERALLRDKSIGRTPDDRSWNALREARLYAEGLSTQEELHEANIESRLIGASAWAATSAASRSARCAALSALSYATIAAAVLAGRGYPFEKANEKIKAQKLAEEKEKEWQCEHLAQMIEAFR